MSLKSLNRRVAATKAKKNEPPKPKPATPIDRSQEKAVKSSQIAITGALTVGFKSLESLLRKILNRPETAPIDPETIKKAVAEGVAKIPQQEIIFPERKPVSYQATIQHRGKKMIGARIDPIIEGK